MRHLISKIFDDSDSLVSLKNENLEFVYVNKAFLKFLDFETENVLGKKANNLFSNEFAKKSVKEDLEAFSGNNTASLLPFDYTKFNGQKCWLKTTKRIVEDDLGQRFLLSTTDDITKDIAVNEEKNRLRKFEAVMHRLSTSIAQAKTEDEVCLAFIKEALTELDLNDVVLYLANNKNKTLKQVVVDNESKVVDGVIIDPKVYSFNQGIVGRAARSKTTQLVNNTLFDNDYEIDDAKRQSELAVPIIIDDELIGVLDSENESQNFYTQFYVDVFETSSNFLGIKIKELRQLEKLKNTTKFLNEILESPKDLVVFSIDKNYNYKAFNQNHRQIMNAIWGAQIEIGDCLLDYILNEDDKVKAKNNFDKALAGNEFTLIEEYGDEGLQRSFYEDFYAPQIAESGEVVGVTVFVRDVTKELSYQKEIEENRSFLNSINTNIRDGICRKSLKKGFIYTNQAMTDLFGYSETEFDSLPIPDVMANPREADGIIDALVQGERLHNKEMLWRKKDGSTFLGLMNCRGYKSGDDFIIDSSIVDITEILETRNKLKQNVTELEKLTTELDHLVYRTSHDLRTPVASLLGLLELLRLDDDPNPKKYMDLFQGQLIRLDQIIRDIINYRKIAKVGMVIETIDLELIIYEVLKDNEFTQGSAKVAKHVEFSDDCKSSIKLDKFSLNILLNNLISNAIKYSDLTKDEPYIKIVASCNSEFVTISVIDNGIGISKDQQNKVFDMFHRATNKSSGSGLGLFILKEAVVKMKGEVELTSVEGKGSTFTVKLPNRA